MKKWLFTYLFIVCNICIHTGVYANPSLTSRIANNNKSSYTTTPGIFTFKKVSPSLPDHPADSNTDIFFQHHGIRAVYSVVSFFIAELNFFVTVSCYVPGEAISKKEVERELKDHLLHLFPSHYFW